MNHQIDKLSKEQALELARRSVKMRKNDEGRMAKVMTSLVGGGAGVAFGAALGYWMGQAEYEYETAENKDAIDAGDEPDPRKWFGIEKDLAAAIIVAGAGIAFLLVKNAKLNRIGSMVASAGFGGLAASLYAKGHESGYKAAKEGTGEEEEA